MGKDTRSRAVSRDPLGIVNAARSSRTTHFCHIFLSLASTHKNTHKDTSLSGAEIVKAAKITGNADRFRHQAMI